MKPTEIYVGLKVVATDSPDATVYMVTKIEGNYIHLIYRLSTGTHVDGGWIDASLLRLPTIQQAINF